MKADYSKEWNLVIPPHDISSSSILLQDGEDLVVDLLGHLYVASPKADYDISAFSSRPWKSLLYPDTKEPNFFLLYKAEKATGKMERIPTAFEMFDFYERFTPWISNEAYLRRLIENGEKVFAIFADDSTLPASLAYTTKGGRQLNSFFTREKYRRRGYGTRLLSMAGPVYLFVEDESLLPFYLSRAFEIRRTYRRQSTVAALK